MPICQRFTKSRDGSLFRKAVDTIVMGFRTMWYRCSNFQDVARKGNQKSGINDKERKARMNIPVSKTERKELVYRIIHHE